jgi:hypothetical protein
MKRWMLALVLGAATVLSIACSGDEGSKLWLSTAMQAHRDADALEQAGDLVGAARILHECAESKAPAGLHAEDGRVVRQDLYYRLSTLKLASGLAREASASATAGLVLGQREDVFVANLLVVWVQALEALGDSRGASRDYHAALRINEALLEAHLSPSPKNP